MRSHKQMEGSLRVTKYRFKDLQYKVYKYEVDDGSPNGLPYMYWEGEYKNHVVTFDYTNGHAYRQNRMLTYEYIQKWLKYWQDMLDMLGVNNAQQ